MMASTAAPLLVDVQFALLKETQAPSREQLSIWAELAALQSIDQASEVTIRLVHKSEITKLNEQYRGKHGASNVLSFPIDEKDIVNIDLLSHRPLGDVIICHDVVVSEAKLQGKTMLEHYAHMVTHGILHLCGYDHIEEHEALEMEALEVAALARSEIANPYK